MRRGWKILIGAVVALAGLLALNAVVVDHETKPAEVTVPGGRILHLPGGDLQIVDKGPRSASPIVLIHCFTCAIDWWNGVMPRLDRTHRVIAMDLLGHGGSEKPASGYSVPDQADVIAQALGRLGVRNAEVVGHSLGGAIAVALAERSPRLVNRLAIIDTPPDDSHSSLGFVAALGFAPVIGEAFWRVKPDFAVRQGLGVAFAPGFHVPDAFVTDVDRMTFSAYDDSHAAFDDYTGAEPLDRRVKATGLPLLVMMGAEEQIINDPRSALAAYASTVPGARTVLIQGAGHSPNVEKPARTAALLLAFAKPLTKGVGSTARGGVVSPNEIQRRKEHRAQAKSGPAARPRNRASGVRGAAAGR